MGLFPSKIWYMLIFSPFPCSPLKMSEYYAFVYCTEYAFVSFIHMNLFKHTQNDRYTRFNYI